MTIEINYNQHDRSFTKALLYELDFNYLLINTNFQNICSIIKFMPPTIQQKLEKKRPIGFIYFYRESNFSTITSKLCSDWQNFYEARKLYELNFLQVFF